MIDGNIRIANGGWHFTYVGGHRHSTAKERVLLKIECAAHQEFNNNFYKSRVQGKIDADEDVFFRKSKFEVVEMNDSYPEYILRNKDKFGHLIREVK